MITWVVMMATIMHALDGTIANVALPSIQGALSATQEQVSWVVTSYIVASAIMTPLAGFCAVRFGLRRILVSAVIGFTIVSMLCGAAQTLEQLVLFRALQGAFGASLVPLSQALMMETYPREEQGKAMALWGVGTMVGPITGPTLGGWLTDEYTWRWVFYINLPVGIVSLIMTRAYVFDPDYVQAIRRGIDYWGLGLLVLGIGALQIVLDKGQQEDWFSSNFILIFTAISAISLVALLVHEFFADDPVIDLRVFRDGNYSAGVFLMTVVGFVLYGSMVLLPIMLQTLLGYPSMEAGIAMAPRGMGSFLMMPLVGILTTKVDVRKLLVTGLAIGGTTMLWLGQLSLNAGFWDIFWPQFFQGAGMALMFVPLTTVSMAAIPREKMGNATSLFNLMRNIGGSVGIAVTATMLSRQSVADRKSTRLNSSHTDISRMPSSA
mgnify:CR=1 FL=1